jgi:hypothetical protein
MTLHTSTALASFGTRNFSVPGGRTLLEMASFQSLESIQSTVMAKLKALSENYLRQ